MENTTNTFQKIHSIVLVPTELPSTIFMTEDDKKLHKSNYSLNNTDKQGNQAICVLSDDELKEGHYAYHTKDNFIFQVCNRNSKMHLDIGNGFALRENCKRIIAIAGLNILISIITKDKTTHKQYLPQLPNEFVNTYITTFNKYGNGFNKAKITYLNNSNKDLQVNEDNTINISIFKSTYTIQEVEALIDAAWEAGSDFGSAEALPSAKKELEDFKKYHLN